MEIQSINEIPSGFCKDLKYLFSDIDDTITSHGIMSWESLQHIWKLHDSGIKVVLVTGRPAGWCDYFARMWPVEGIIGENGAFYFKYNRSLKKMNRIYLQSEGERTAGQYRLNRIKERVLAEVPGSAISADQSFRISDLAVDFCEDVTPLGKEAIDTICRIAGEEGAVYKVSSIHVNCWVGDYNKLTCFNRFLEDSEGATLEQLEDQIIYIGDSPNDEPMFQNLKYSAAVNNIINFTDSMSYFPAYKSLKNSGEGFCEIVDVILNNRGY